MTNKYDVVISGMSGRFPECNSVEEFKDKLFAKENLITVNNKRWPVGYNYRLGKEIIPDGTGKIKNLDLLDARAFQINHILINCYDILNAIVLEPAFEAVIDAGINPSSLNGSCVGVYSTFTVSEYEALKTYVYPTASHSMYVLGASKTMMSNRISFAMNLIGPSCSFTSSFHGGMEALKTAYRDVMDGIVEGAIVVVSNAILDPRFSVQSVQLGLLSPDGLCRAFDENADGYGRSDGAVAFFLQRAESARRIYGKVLYSDFKSIGSKSKSLLWVDDDMIKRSFNEIYSSCSVQPRDLSFIEMNTCGVLYIDHAEIIAVGDMFCKDRKDPLYVGSVKSNTGHMEAASFMVSVVKALISLDSEFIPPNINFIKPDLKMKPLVNGKLKVITEKTKLPGPVVGVNSIGITGILSHIILQQHSKINEKSSAISDLPRLFLLFGRTEEGVMRGLNKVESMPLDTNFIAFANDVFKIPIQSQMYRGYTILPPIPNTVNGVSILGAKRPVWFLFSGMGSQWNGMGEDLLKIPIFAAAIDKIDAVLRPRNVDIREIITSKDPRIFDNITMCFVGIISIQIGLVDILRALGVKPDGIIGHSVGETACAYADGCFTAEEAVLSAYSRGLASLEKETIKGLMASVGKGYDQLKDSLPSSIDIACHNSSQNCTISGPEDDINKVVQQLKSEGIFAKTVNTANIAYHSKHIAPAGPLLHQKLKEVVSEPKLRSSIWVSTSVPESEWNSDRAKYSSAEYHANNFLNPVLFEEGCKHIPDDAVVIEISPHGLLQAIVKRSLSDRCINLPLAIRSAQYGGISYLLSAIGKLYLAGCKLDVNSLYPEVKYPVPRGTPSLANFVSWNHSENFDTFNFVQPVPMSQETIRVSLNKCTQYSYLSSHKIKGQCVIPPSFYMYLTWHTLAMDQNKKISSFPVIFEDIRVHNNIYITLANPKLLTVMVQYGSGNFEVLLMDPIEDDAEEVIMTGKIIVQFEEIKVHFNEQMPDQLKYKFNSAQFYEILKKFDYELDGVFNNVQEITYNNNTECYGYIVWNHNWVAFLDSVMKMYMYTEPNVKNQLIFPERIFRLTIIPSVFEQLKSGDRVFCYKDRTLNRLACDGLEMFRFHFKPLQMAVFDESVNKLKGVRFICHLNPQLLDEESFILLSLQLVAENAPIMVNYENPVIYVIQVTSGDMIRKVKKISNNDIRLKSKFVYGKKVEIMKKSFDTEQCYLFVANYLDEIATKNIMNCKFHHLFVLITVTVSQFNFIDFGASLTIIAKQIFDDIVICLLKKVPDTRCSNIVMADSTHTVTEYESKSKKSSGVTVVWSKHQLLDLMDILSHSARLTRVRSLVILDEKAPPFSENNSVYKNQLIQDLKVAVLKHGEWGSYKNVSNSLASLPYGKDEALKTITSHIRMESVNIEYLNMDKETVVGRNNIEITKYGLEYSGCTKSGERIMGLAIYNPLNDCTSADKYLTWNVPEYWSLEDACTIPLLYSQAYYVLFYLPFRCNVRSILIHGGDTPFGETCIRLVLGKMNCQLYTTVSNKHNAKLIRTKFPAIPYAQVLLNSDCNYDTKMKLMKNEDGFDIIINTLPGKDHQVASCNCCGKFTRYIEFEDSSRFNTQLGLLPFLKGTSFFIVKNKIHFMVNLSPDIKMVIQEFIRDNIKSGIIKPLDRDIRLLNGYEEYNTKSWLKKKQIIRYLLQSDNTQDMVVQKFRCDGNSSFIVIDGDKSLNTWYELVEWLINHGARKFVVTTENFLFNAKMSQQINKRILRLKSFITFTSMRNAETLHGAKNMILDANKMGKLEAIFFTSMDSHRNSVISNMDIASRSIKPCHFISLMSGGLNVCELRRESGLPAIVINAEKSVAKISQILPHLWTLLSQIDNINDPVLFDFNDYTEMQVTNDNNSTQLRNFFPSSLHALEDIGNFIEDTPHFIEVPTLSLKFAETKGVLPVFVFPGIDKCLLKSITKKLFYPTFCASLPYCFVTCANIASILLQEIEKIQPFGPVTLVGETWCGCIAIEVASILQSVDRRVRLFLIEGSLTMWQSVMKCIGKVNSFQFRNILLKNIFGYNALTGMSNGDSSEVDITWDRLLQMYLRDYPESSRKSISLVLNSIHNRLIAASQYTPNGQPLKHIIHFKQRNTMPHNQFLEEYCLSDDVYVFEDYKYEDFIKNPSIVNIINDQADFSWNLKTD